MDEREHLKGSGDQTEHFIFFFCIHFTYIWIFTHCSVTSCGFIVHGLLSSTLTKRLNLYPPTTTQKCWHARAHPVVTMRWIPGVTVWGVQESTFQYVLNVSAESTVGVWTVMTQLKDSCYLKTLVAILSGRKQLNLASLVGYLWFNRRGWFMGREASSAGIHQHSDTPSRRILCLLEMVHSTVFPGTDPVCCELFIADNASASANAWFCSEKERDALGWYRVKGINSDIVGAAPGPCDHGRRAEPRETTPISKVKLGSRCVETWLEN